MASVGQKVYAPGVAVSEGNGGLPKIDLKLVEFKNLTLFRGITIQDLKEHLLERRKIYMRVCELANHSYIIGFLQTNCKIWMRPEVYEMHIKVTLI